MDYKYKDLFLQDSVKKELYISFDNGLITNSELHSNQFELSESICSDSELRFGGCEASEIRFKVSNVYNSLKNKTIDVSMVLDGNEDEPFVFGRYTVYSDTPTADRNFRDIVAYDKMYDIINSDVAEWYNGLTFPLTMKDFRTSFVSHFGMEEVATTLINDNMIVEKTIDVQSLSGKDVAFFICEINGCFGHISCDGKFEYIYLSKSDTIYPENALYPSSNIYPSIEIHSENKTDISKSHYISCKYDDFITKKIDSVHIRQVEGDENVAMFGSGKNPYIIQDNFLLYGKSQNDLKLISKNLLNVIRHISYRPSEVVSIGNPSLKIGSYIQLSTKNEIIKTYVLSRKISGIQSLKDFYESNGVEYYKKNLNSPREEIIQLKKKTNTIIRTVEQNKLEVENLEEELRSEITQTANEIRTEVESEEEELRSEITQNKNAITSKVSKGSVSSEISQEVEQVSIKGNRLVVESENFELDKNGNVHISGWLDVEEGINLSAPYVNSETDPTQVMFDAFGYAINILDSTQTKFSPYLFINNPFSQWAFLINNESILSYLPVTCNRGLKSSSLEVTGTKSRITNTSNYGERLLYCYETPSPMFGDIGEGRLDEAGKCYVCIDDMFGETIDLNCTYQVFLQAYGKGECYITERTPSYFVVEGTENLSFGWEIKAIQKSYDTMRLEEYKVESYADVTGETSNYLSNVVNASNKNVVTETYNYLTESLYSPESEVI